MNSDTPEVGRLQLGETLRKARESRGWSIQDVASQLNLTRQIVGSLEAGDFGGMPHTFARGYLRAYAKLLGMDAQRMALEFDRVTGTNAAAGATVQQLARIDEPVRGSQRVLRLVSILLALALLGGGFYWWQQHNPEPLERSAIPEHIEVESADGTTQLHPLTEPEDAAVAEIQGEAPQPPQDLSAELSGADASEESAGSVAAVQGETAVPAPAETEQAAAPVQSAPTQPTVQPTTPLVPAPGAPAAPTAPAAEAAVAPNVPAAPAPVDAAATPVAPVPEAAAPAAAQAPTPGEGEGLLEISFSETCWIEVADGRGKVLHSALKRKGESIQIAGKTPLRLHLGYAKGANVRFNGQPVDVASHARGETARLILGQ